MSNVWYKQKIEEVLENLEISQSGLSEKDAKKRLSRYGLNKLPESKPDSLFVVFFKQFQSPLIYLLLVASIIVFLMQEWVDGFIIIFVLVFNAIAGTVQEGRAQNTLEALKKFSETNATVLRDGKEKIILDHFVVPGDVIFLQEGEKVPADARVLNSKNLRLNEAILTGEPDPSGKHTDQIDKENLPPADQKNMIFKGTSVISGNGKAVIVSTGTHTEIGKISEKMEKIDTELPLQKNIKNLSNLIILAVLILTSAIFSIGLLTGGEVKEIFLLSVAIIISAVPEGLPIVITLLLASGVWRMSKQNVLVKRLQAVEALGKAQVIAVDKTGTITKNELVVQNLFTGWREYSVTGVGYNALGQIFLGNQEIEINKHPLVERAGIIAGLCSNARLFEKEDGWTVAGDPTEAALLVLSYKIGLTKDDLENDYPEIGELPFDSKSKYHATLNKFDGQNYISVAGAPEVLLNLSDEILIDGQAQKIEQDDRGKIVDIFSQMSRKGLRIIALCEKKVSENELTKEMVNKLVFVGLVGMKDALREEVFEAMRKTREAGVRVVMITGDHRITAQAIATDAGIFKEGDEILTDEDLEKISLEDLAKRLDKVSVFARITPDHKMKIIEAYRLRGEVVAMTGDGVNDALSLVSADLGVSMGKSGTEVAKEAADLILLDDNFGSIVSAIEEGRSIYKNLKKVLLFLFSTNLGEVIIIFVALVAGLPLPILAAQLIWLNLVTDGFLDVALAMEGKEKDILKEKYKKPTKWIFDGWMLQRMILMSTVMAIGALIVFVYYLENHSYELALSVTLTTMAAFQWFNAWNCRSDFRSIFNMKFTGNKYLIGGTLLAIIFQIAALYTPFLQGILRLTPLGFQEWGIVITVSLSMIVVDEIRKLFYRKFERKNDLIEVRV